MRDGRKVELPAVELVVGDIVFVKIGDKTPAGINMNKFLFQKMKMFSFYRRYSNFICSKF
jgi:hypothetical protein